MSGVTGAAIGAVALGAGASAYGARKAGKAANRANATAQQQADLSSALFEQSDPLRQALLGRSEQFLGIPSDGGLPGMMSGTPGVTGVKVGPKGMLIPDFSMTSPQAVQNPGAPQFKSGMEAVMDSPTYLAFKEATGDTFGRARENTMARLPGGGALLESLAGIEGSQASTLSQGAGQIYENEMSRALSLATGNVPVALSGLGQAAYSQSANAAAMGQQSSAKADSTGQAAGAYLGSK